MELELELELDRGLALIVVAVQLGGFASDLNGLLYACSSFQPGVSGDSVTIVNGFHGLFPFYC